MIVGIIGLGLIGGSMAIDLKRRGFARIVLGVEADPVNAAAAERMELVDEIVPFEECVRRSDITVIAIPVGSAVKMLPQVLDIFKEEGNGKKIVIDTCSTKSNIVRAAHYHPSAAASWRHTRWPALNIQGLGPRCRTSLMAAPAYSQTPRILTRRRSRWLRDCMMR